MKAFTIHEPPEPPVERLDHAEALIFVKDGFNWSAFLLAPIWFALNSIWPALAGYICAMAAIIGLVAISGQGETAIMFGVAAFMILHLLAGLEADTILRWKLNRDGWRELGAVTGPNQDQCERNFFDAWLAAHPEISHRPPGAAALGKRMLKS